MCRAFHILHRNWGAKFQMLHIEGFKFHVGKSQLPFSYGKHRIPYFIGISGLNFPYMKHQKFHLSCTKSVHSFQYVQGKHFIFHLGKSHPCTYFMLENLN